MEVPHPPWQSGERGRGREGRDEHEVARQVDAEDDEQQTGDQDIQHAYCSQGADVGDQSIYVDHITVQEEESRGRKDGGARGAIEMSSLRILVIIVVDAFLLSPAMALAQITMFGEEQAIAPAKGDD